MGAKRRTKIKRPFLAVILAVGVLLLLITLNDSLKIPFLPTWDELYRAANLNLEEPSGGFAMHVLSVGKADSILLTSGDHAMLVDGGNKGDGKTVLKYLQKQGISQLDYVFATHPHEDHIGGLPDVIGGIKVGQVWTSKLPNSLVPTSSVYKDFLLACQQAQVPLQTVSAGMTLSLGDAAIVVLAPSGQYTSLNNYSVVLRVTYGVNSFLLEGDAESESEKDMMARGYSLKANVLKVAHHGSSTSGTDKFITAVSPQYAVISTSLEDYQQGEFPTAKTLKTLQGHQVKVYDTGNSGNVVFYSDGKKITVSTDK